MRIKSKLNSSTNFFQPYGMGKLGRMSANESRLGRYLREGDHVQFDFPDFVDDIAVVPERVRALYVKDETSGKFKMDDVNSLRSTLGHIKEENKSVKGKLSGFKSIEALGVSAEDVKAMLEEREAAKEKKAKEEGDWASLREQMEANHATAVKEKDEKINKLTKWAQTSLLDKEAIAAMSHKDIQGNPRFLMPTIRDRVEVTETDDGFDIVVRREDGAPMLNSESKPASIKDLLLELKKNPEYAAAFQGLNQSGGGAPGGNGSGGGAPGALKRSQMSTAQKAAYVREHGQAEYLKLPM